MNKNLLFDKFKIIKCLKKDECGGVYLANHIYLGKDIFLKTLNKNNISDKIFLDRFKREAKILASLDHPNIIRVFDFGTWKNYFYISFEYFPSQNLREIIKSNTLNNKQKESLVVQIASALHAAHKNHIIHRDLKPENILVNSNLDLKIADFGLAFLSNETRSTSPASIVGTPAYMSPEQIRGEELTIQSDLFSLGVIICELFTGKNLFLGKDTGETLNNILECQTENIIEQVQDLPELIQILARNLVQKKSKDRFISAKQIIEKFDFEEQVSEKKAKIKFAKPVSTYKRWATSGAVLAVVFILVFVLLFKKHTYQTTENNSQILQESTADNLNTDLKNNQEHDKDISQINRNYVYENETEKSLTITTINDNAKLSELPGALDIACYPWAYVYIDSVKIDSTPIKNQIELLPGQYTLQLIHPDYPAFDSKIQIESEKITPVKVNFDTLVGFLDCQVYPWGEVYIDNELIGQTPLKKLLHLEQGKHSLKIKNKNYKEYVTQIEIYRKDTLNFKFSFE